MSPSLLGHYNMMNYEKDAAQKGKSNLIWGFSFTIIIIILDVFVFLKKGEFPKYLVIFTLFWLLICYGFISSGIKLICNGGKWLISVTSNNISWVTPNTDIDKSFNFRLSEIKHIETKIWRRAKRSPVRKYSIILNNGTIQRINENSGVSIAQVFIELERNGVESVVIGDT
jgi:hypothetical protein